jgi:osmoprotectant transport system permease protein
MIEFLQQGHRFSDLLIQARDHIVIVIVAVLIASVIGVGIGILTYRNRWAYQLAIGTSSAFLTIPSLALLGLLIPLLGLGFVPALVALVVYALLPIIRNTVTGLHSIDPALLEAARGTGMRERMVLTQIQLPLAWPIILAGIRVATQLTVGVAAIAAYVSGPGLGNNIFAGLATMGSKNAVNLALSGTIGVIILALLFDAAFVLITRLTIPRGLRA